MGVYHARSHSKSVRSQPARVPPKTKKCGIFDLAECYNVPDMTDFSGTDFGSAEQTIDEEYLSYTTGRLEDKDLSDIDILTFWEVGTLAVVMLASDELMMRCGNAQQANEFRFPTLFAIALDYLPIQALAVPCERVFSSSAETDTKRRNRIHPLLMEALQMLKFSRKRNRLDFMDGWSTQESVMLTTPDEEPDLLSTIKDAQSSLDKVIAAVNSDDNASEIGDVDIDDV